MTKRIVRVEFLLDSEDWDLPGRDSDNFAKDVVSDHLQRSGSSDYGYYYVTGVEVVSEERAAEIIGKLVPHTTRKISHPRPDDLVLRTDELKG